MKRFLLFVVSVFLNIAMLSAQNSSSVISGEVKDSKGTLAGASVFLIKDMSTQDIYQHTITDDNGRFSITVPVGDYVLGVSYVGYALHGQKINVTEGNNNVGSIVLEETTQELQNVVVQGKIVHVRTQPDGFSVDVKDIRDANKQLQPL
ncbi:MAG: carboxypeptidase-like regulatory domain-containing protein [Prevotella pallens]|jgi:possible tonB-dependent receptor|uniref:TonB-linked outer membrane protein, SusC/RagA family n=1 Tax=Prevotella pallens TaxID=60133 RepID=A0A379GA98_9BACT|nr:carboxypeptidase-like regulatory domain-containing protein [Prevotella pallens]MBF1479973.1 carboxypeptidase-like regulatory domain-containing protein [Prevotella pallens]MBF1509592.1 carboxypeptidase-like regulatory domain-containing protein [Prevotella pallens]MBF1510554.1 carboxypeptidase-like regulatory domain-containing protein [Prevotella pallens]MBF1515394.1 carboxypeptidase-like regulatory domain-containing protein [Prevotella pallens]SUC37897.1 TonB-linked outer membrane protein, S